MCDVVIIDVLRDDVFLDLFEYLWIGVGRSFQSPEKPSYLLPTTVVCVLQGVLKGQWQMPSCPK
jgi:hypothetical protein